MTEKGFKLLGHPAFSPDLVPSDFFLFPQLKIDLAGSRFETEQELKTAVQGSLEVLSQNGLYHVFESWVKRCDTCMYCEAGRGYVKK